MGTTIGDYIGTTIGIRFPIPTKHQTVRRSEVKDAGPEFSFVQMGFNACAAVPLPVHLAFLGI